MNMPYQAYPSRNDPDYWRKVLARGPAIELPVNLDHQKTPEETAALVAWYDAKDRRGEPTGD
jgi:hypothetical protein